MRYFRVGNDGEEARGHGVELAVERGGDLGVPLGSEFDEALFGGGFVALASGLVEAEFDDRDVGVAQLEEVVQLGLGQIEFNLIECIERGAEVHEDHVAFVAELRVESRAKGRIRRLTFKMAQGGDGVGRDAFAFGGSESPPGFPVEAEELVEEE